MLKGNPPNSYHSAILIVCIFELSITLKTVAWIFVSKMNIHAETLWQCFHSRSRNEANSFRLYLLIQRDILWNFFYRPLANTIHKTKFFRDFNGWIEETSWIAFVQTLCTSFGDFCNKEHVKYSYDQIFILHFNSYSSFGTFDGFVTASLCTARLFIHLFILSCVVALMIFLYNI